MRKWKLRVGILLWRGMDYFLLLPMDRRIFMFFNMILKVLFTTLWPRGRGVNGRSTIVIWESTYSTGGFSCRSFTNQDFEDEEDEFQRVKGGSREFVPWDNDFSRRKSGFYFCY